MTDELGPQLAPLDGPPAGDAPDPRPDVPGAVIPAAEEHVPAPETLPEVDDGRGPSFTSAEKVYALVQQARARLNDDRSAMGFALRTIVKLAERSGVFRFAPGWDQPDEWDAMLALFAGTSVTLLSDHKIEWFDLEAAKRQGEEVLSRVFANQER